MAGEIIKKSKSRGKKGGKDEKKKRKEKKRKEKKRKEKRKLGKIEVRWWEIKIDVETVLVMENE